MCSRFWLTFFFTASITVSAQNPQSPQRPSPGGNFAWWERPWWSGRLVQDLNLSDTQKEDIRAVVSDYRARIADIRSTIRKADADLAASFAENPVDQKKANDAIDRLAAARADLTRSLSQMSLRMRTVLTADQWQELQRRMPQPGQDGRGRRVPSGP